MDFTVNVIAILLFSMTIITFHFDVAYYSALKTLKTCFLGYCHCLRYLQRSTMFKDITSYVAASLPNLLESVIAETPPYSALLICFSVTLHATSYYLNNKSLCMEALDAETCASAPITFHVTQDFFTYLLIYEMLYTFSFFFLILTDYMARSLLWFSNTILYSIFFLHDVQACIRRSKIGTLLFLYC